MAQILRKSWPKGWLPCSDKINGDKEGLLRMDNLYQDEEGVLSLVRGIQKVGSAYPAGAYDAYSKYINNTKHRYAALLDGQVYRDSTSIITDGSNEATAFGSEFGHVIICSGSKRKIDTGTNVYNLTPAKPEAPSNAVTNQPSVSLAFDYASWTIYSGWGLNLVNGADYIQVDTKAAAPINRAYVWVQGGPIDSTFGAGFDPTEDLFKIGVRIENSSKLSYVRVSILLDDPATIASFGYSPNQYNYTWQYNTGEGIFSEGLDAWSDLKVARKNFLRLGADSTKGWTSVTGIMVEIVSTDSMVNNAITGPVFLGGEGALWGSYKYAQVNVYNTGANEFKSELGVETREVYVFKGEVTLTPSAVLDPQVNEIWFFRRDSGTSEDIVPTDTPRILDQWYRVATTTPGVPVKDQLSDLDAIKLGITWNENLRSVLDLPDPIVRMETEIAGRTLYLTNKELYISDALDPGLYDAEATVRLSGDVTEKNLWIKKVSLGSVVIATTKDFYEVSGTFNRLADGTVDAAIRNYGVGRPAISRDVAKENSRIFYMASDGIRFVGGSENDLITAQLDLLFRDSERYGISPLVIVPNGGTQYPLAIAKDKLWFGARLQDGTRPVFVCDLRNNYWYLYYTDPVCLFEEEDGTLIGGYGTASGPYLREIDTGNSLDGEFGQPVYFQTVYDDDNLPKNRKDTFTFKILADTGNVPVNIYIAKNGTDAFQLIGRTAFNGVQEKVITVADSVGLGKNFSFRITGIELYTFKLYNIALEYDPRPEQLTYLRIPYTNLGTSSRKRFVNFPFVIDTLGETCEFTPLVDGSVVGDPSTFTMSRKGTYIHYFDENTEGIDIGGILCGFFEYYGPNLDEIISEKMPTATTFLRIPQDDYGVPARKRHSSYKFVINTKGYNVQFTPRLDGVDQAPLTINTTEKSVAEYFFSGDTIAINIGGKIESLEDPKKPFEFYGPIKPEKLEVLPPRLKEYRIPENNYGVASHKRIRTMPLEINTNGFPVTFTPIVDGVAGTPTIINTTTRATTFHYFSTDVFGVDFSGELVGNNPFEFYGLLKPESVEVIPVGKLFDQVGPIRFDKLAKFQALRIRLISRADVDIPIKIITENERTFPSMSGTVGEYNGVIRARANFDEVYEKILPKTVNGTVFRLEIGPTPQPFHRYDIQVKTVISGMEANPKWIKVGVSNENR